MSDRLPIPGKVYRIEVTREHLEAGKPRAGDGCAIALALQDAFPGLELVRVRPVTATARQGATSWAWTHGAKEFIERFDAGDATGPRVVTLTPCPD